MLLTQSPARADSHERDVATFRVRRQFEDLVQHDGDGGDTHAVL